MTTIELEQVIQDYFMDIYGKHYVGKMCIKKLDPVGYRIEFFMDRVNNRPTVIYAELEDKKFLKFLKLLIRDMRINLIYWGILNLTYRTDCNPINTSCNCHDQG